MRLKKKLNMRCVVIPIANVKGTTISNEYRFGTEKGIIALRYPSKDTMHSYQIICIKGDYFDEPERYSSYAIVMGRINDLLL